MIITIVVYDCDVFEIINYAAGRRPARGQPSQPAVVLLVINVVDVSSTTPPSSTDNHKTRTAAYQPMPPHDNTFITTCTYTCLQGINPHGSHCNRHVRCYRFMAIIYVREPCVYLSIHVN